MSSDAVCVRVRQVIVEEYIAGREVRCGVLEEDDGSMTLLPMTEYFLDNIRTSAHKLATDAQGCPLTTSEAIVKTDGDRQCPAEIDEPLRRKIEEQAFLAHRAMQARDFSLYDVRIDPSGEPFFLEACNFCSFSPKSAMVAMANADPPNPARIAMCGPPFWRVGSRVPLGVAVRGHERQFTHEPARTCRSWPVSMCTSLSAPGRAPIATSISRPASATGRPWSKP